MPQLLTTNSLVDCDAYPRQASSASAVSDRNVFTLITTLYLCFVFGGVALVCSTNNVSFTLTARFPFVFGSPVLFRCSVKIRKQKKLFCFLFSCLIFFFFLFFFLWACKADTFTSCCKEQRDRQPSLWPMKSKNKCVCVWNETPAAYLSSDEFDLTAQWTDWSQWIGLMNTEFEESALKNTHMHTSSRFPV